MRKAIPLGVVDYEILKNLNYYFIDKSMMISDFLTRKSTVTLITRPRRFGKTVNISMMASFFDMTKDSKELFKDTKIVETEYMSEMNQYPTIFISFANAKNDKWNVVKESELPRLTLRLEVRASCFNHHCLAGNLTALSGLHDVYKRYIRLIPSLYVLY